MNYRLQALILGIFMLLIGSTILVFAAVQSQTVAYNQTEVLPAQLANKISQVSIIVFIGLGLILIGTLATFAAPVTLVPSEIVSNSLSPSAENLSLIVESSPNGGRVLHTPKVILGGESQVLLVFSGDSKEESLNLALTDGYVWGRQRKVLHPAGIALMKKFEEVLKRDFLEIDTQQLSRLLAKAIVSELQLSSGFTLREISTAHIEVTWTKPTIVHTCLLQDGYSHPSLCYLCSSVACALAKATGKPVWIENSNRLTAESGVITTYRVMGA